MTPRAEALAYRIWCYCEPRGWDCTHREVADALDVPLKRVSHVCTVKGWASRLRVTHQHWTGAWADLRLKHDDLLEAMG
jgi:hypothetical protein